VHQCIHTAFNTGWPQTDIFLYRRRQDSAQVISITTASKYKMPRNYF